MENSQLPEEVNASTDECLVEPCKTPKEWFLNCFVGFFVGLAIIVPGISGATITIIFKIYEKLLNAVSNLFKKFKNCFLYLLPIAIGAIIGFIGGFFGIKYALSYIPFAIVCLFGGLMIGAFPAVTDEIKGEKKTPLRITLLILGFAIPVVLSIVVTLYTGTDNGQGFDTIEWWEYIAFLFVGFVIAITQVVPGLSASAFLMMIGYFSAFMNSISLTFWKSNPAIFGIYAMLAIGFILGFFITSKFLNKLFLKSKATTFFAIVGLSLGAIVSIFFNKDIYELYQIWAGTIDKTTTDYANCVSMTLDISLGVGLLIVGFAISFALYLYQKKHDEKEKLKLDN